MIFFRPKNIPELKLYLIYKLESVLKHIPFLAEIFYSIFFKYMKKKSIDLFFAKFFKRKKAYNYASDIYKNLIERDPKNITAYKGIIEVCVATKEYELANLYLSDFKDIFITSSKRNEIIKAEDYFYIQYFSYSFKSELIHLTATYCSDHGADFIVVGQSITSEHEHRTPLERAFANDPELSYLITTVPYNDKLWGDLPQYDENYFTQIFKQRGFVTSKRGKINPDDSSEFVNIVGGIRYTVDSPQIYDNVIYLIGNSWVFGHGVEDKHTIASYLQKKINNLDSKKKYKVVNCGAMGHQLLDCYYSLTKTSLRKNDIVILDIFSLNELKEIKSQFADNIKYISCDFSERKDKSEVFWNSTHVTYKGNKLLAEIIFENISKSFNNGSDLVSGQYVKPKNIPEEKLTKVLETLTEMKEKYDKFSDSIRIHPDFINFMNELKQIKLSPGKTGATIVNCNPFTLGHKYLIERSAAEVDNFIVFVIEEDKSFFTYEERFNLVKQGCKHIDNVIVVRSGMFLSSYLTIPDYFSKEESDTMHLDATLEAYSFGEYIAPVLNIETLYLGEEPNCNITFQYNEQCKVILPSYGVKVIEFPRKYVHGKAISASKVRKHYIKGSIEEIRELIPMTTYNYLLNTPYNEKRVTPKKN